MILIPAYKPDENLIDLVREIKESFTVNDEEPPQIIIVNDGSPSKYDSIFNRLHNESLVLTHDNNRGKGEALKTGFREVIKNKFPFVVTADADGQHLAKDIRKVWLATKDSKELVLGVRNFSSATPFRSRIGNLLTSKIFKMMFGIKLSDTQTGLRGIPCGFLELMLSIPNSKYDYETACLVALPDKEAIKQITISTVYEHGNPTSHFNPLIDSFKIYWVLFRSAICSMLSALFDFIVFSCLVLFGLDIFKSVVFARVSSVTVSFYLAKNVAFKSNVGSLRSGFKFTLLVIFNIALVAYLTEYLDSILNIKTQIVYIFVSLCLFMVNFIIQKRFIFA